MKTWGSTAFQTLTSNLAWLQNLGKKGSLEIEEAKETSRDKSQQSSYAKQSELTFFKKLIAKYIKKSFRSKLCNQAYFSVEHASKPMVFATVHPRLSQGAGMKMRNRCKKIKILNWDQ